ncbi:MAG: right-handed parallel beta-helix repeat-containing protein, partial [Candidatus Cloacimonetes bacterium]|nr:right-handed parallel beta-helix repeat-containing protein [Candidatus Cloacimonadota bacterium]
MKKIFFFFILHFTFLSRRSNILLAVLCVGGLLFTFLPWCIPGSFLPADTHIPPGDVSGTWTIYGSPYIVDGFVTVPVDSTLIIEPSVFVIFSTNNGLQIEGRLLSEGTENDSITFTVQDSSNNTGLGFYHTDITNQDSSKITYSIFEHVSVCFDKSSNILFRKSSVSKCVGWSGVFFDENSSPRLIDITISNNTTEYYGGGLYCTDYSNPSLVNVTISGNSATCGGGISCRFNSNPTLENVNIINNSAIGAGGGIFCEESNPILNYVDIIENHVSNGIGGGIHFDENSNPEISNVNIENNSAYWGGGIGCTNSSPVL